MDEVSDEYIKRLISTVDFQGNKLPVLSKKKLSKGSKTTPGMRLATYPTFAELENWRQMHQHTTFNEDRIVREKDVLESLKYANPKTKIATLPSSYMILKEHKIHKGKQQNELIKEAKINKNLTYLSSVSKYPHPDYWPKASDSHFKPTKFEPFPKLPEKELHYEAAGPPCINPLLRRPLAPVWRNKDSLARESSLSIILAEDGKYDLDQWRKCSLTTLFKDDPLDPRSFYNTHYPLLLKQVPRRFKNNDEGSENIDTMYRPMSRTPDIDMRYFDVMSRISLSDEIVLPPYGERCGSSGGRDSFSPRSLKSTTPDTKSTPDIQEVCNAQETAQQESKDSHETVELDPEFNEDDDINSKDVKGTSSGCSSKDNSREEDESSS